MKGLTATSNTQIRSKPIPKRMKSPSKISRKASTTLPCSSKLANYIQQMVAVMQKMENCMPSILLIRSNIISAQAFLPLSSLVIGENM